LKEVLSSFLFNEAKSITSTLEEPMDVGQKLACYCLPDFATNSVASYFHIFPII